MEFKGGFREDLKTGLKEDVNILELYKKHLEPELSIILPCRNEEQALPYCLNQIKQVIKQHNLNAEIIVSDSSIDKSPEIARKEKVILVKHDKEGYGIAYLEAFKHARGKYIFMADCDGTYDFNEIPNFLNSLKQGYDFVIGNRFAYSHEKGAMPWSHKYIGNPILSGLLRLFFGTTIKDSYCGMRAIKKQALERIDLQTTGMEFALDMVIKSLKYKLRIKELPIHYHKRIGNSKLKTLLDGWRSIRFMLLYSPLYLFFIPGFILFFIGITTLIWFSFTDPVLFGKTFYLHPMFLSAGLVIVGYQLITFSVFAKTYAIFHLNETSPLTKFYKYITIENASITGILIAIAGAIIYLTVLIKWINSNFGYIEETKTLILGLTLGIIGIQTIFSSFMLSILTIKER